MFWDQVKYPAAFELVINDKGHLAIKEADEHSNPELTFGEAGRDPTEPELRSMWATMVATAKEQGLEISAENLVLYVDKLQENGRLVAERAATTKQSGWDLSYPAWQAERHPAFIIEMHAKYAKPQLWLLAVNRGSKPAKAPKAPPPKLIAKRVNGPTVQAAPAKPKGPRRA